MKNVPSVPQGMLLKKLFLNLYNVYMNIIKLLFFTSFLISRTCPYNLLGRDIMCKLHMTVWCDEVTGLNVTLCKEVCLSVFVGERPESDAGLKTH